MLNRLMLIVKWRWHSLCECGRHFTHW